jgi:hypothetical protein
VVAAIAFCQWLRGTAFWDLNASLRIQLERHAPIFEDRFGVRVFRGVNAVPAVGAAFVTDIQTPFGDVITLINVAAELKGPFAQEAFVKECGVSHPEPPQSGQKCSTLGKRSHCNRAIMSPSGQSVQRRLKRVLGRSGFRLICFADGH